MPVASKFNADASAPDAWLARLSLAFTAVASSTRLRFCHEGPLRIQKALYPEGLHCCHAVIVHPPGGVAAGDRLDLDIRVDKDAQAVVTTPSATKWYGAFDRAVAAQRVTMQVQGRLEWLPAETIIFDSACVASDIRIDVGESASMLGWDLLVFGRHGSGERFNTGHFTQTLTVAFDGKDTWTDRMVLCGQDRLFDSPVGFDGHHAVATFWALAPESEDIGQELIETLRHDVPEMVFTRLHRRLLVGRQIGDPIELDIALKRVRAWMRHNAWAAPEADLRLWAT
jgi:urease accessory protein